MKQYFLFLYVILYFLFNKVFAGAHLECSNLIGCDQDMNSSDGPLGIIGEFIGKMILYTAVIAVIALMISGIFYIISFGEEEKTKKAKKWIIWSLIGVVMSVSSWFIINSINNLSV